MRSPTDRTTRSLEGRSVLVTRARAQSREITAGIESLGGTVIHCPTIEFIGPSDPAALDSAISRLENFDWIVFASSNAVSFFFERLNQRRPEAVESLVSLVTC